MVQVEVEEQRLSRASLTGWRTIYSHLWLTSGVTSSRSPEGRGLRAVTGVIDGRL